MEMTSFVMLCDSTNAMECYQVESVYSVGRVTTILPI